MPMLYCLKNWLIANFLLESLDEELPWLLPEALLPDEPCSLPITPLTDAGERDFDLQMRCLISPHRLV